MQAVRFHEAGGLAFFIRGKIPKNLSNITQAFRRWDQWRVSKTIGKS